jgi:DNA helicase-2/ATP-dependent DNA helicase PcrA
MDREYKLSYRALNPQQKAAVDTIEGPVLVIAGPGTGKTQLLTTRVAHILSITDSLPQSILCLTFSDSAAHAMRQRLTNLIGAAAYDVNISTYHAFGSDLIRRFPEFFSDNMITRPVDDLTIDAICRRIVSQLPYSNPLKFSDNYIGDIKQFISDAKRAYLSPADLRKICRSNQQFIDKTKTLVQGIFKGLVRIDKKTAERFYQLDKLLAGEQVKTSLPGGITHLSLLAREDLQAALARYQDSGKTNPLTAWKNKWLIKDASGNYSFDGDRANQKMLAGAGIYQSYLSELAKLNVYDYDDMILSAIEGLTKNPDLLSAIQEQYLYILLDEFQDTNGSQLKLVELLTDNPVNEGRPNVLAVGDDDQAIYAFQGAHYSHMLQFYQHYPSVNVISLTKNYRSTQPILNLAGSVSSQISERLQDTIEGVDKKLTAEGATQKTILKRLDAKSDVFQFEWLARQIKKLSSSIALNEIAVLAPQHKYLEPLVAFLHAHQLPVRYEKRENILDDQVLKQLITMAELCLAIQLVDKQACDALWPEVLSFDFWGMPTAAVWAISWQANDARLDWTQALSNDPNFSSVAQFFIRLSALSLSETLEAMLDYLIGVSSLEIGTDISYKSPFFEYYFGEKTKQSLGTFWQLLSNLIVLRAKLRDYRDSDSNTHLLADLLNFIHEHRDANLKILNTNPYNEADQAVQLMTAYKAKGQEYSVVFIVSCNDETWGSRARRQQSRIAMPINLKPIRYDGETEDEKLRLFYVALTRAKNQLYLVNYLNSYSGRDTTRLKYLDETESGTSPLLPEPYSLIEQVEDSEVEPTTELSAYWQEKHRTALTDANLRSMLVERLERYKLSPTHLIDFIDLSQAGPRGFLLNTILRFPKNPSPSAHYGSVMHETLQWIHLDNLQNSKLPSPASTKQRFSLLLSQKPLSSTTHDLLQSRGQASLAAYLSQRKSTINSSNKSEYNFNGENVIVDGVIMGGKIDKLIINPDDKTIVIVDYKTGSNYTRWQPVIRLHKYRQQLYLYKLLVENSRSFHGYKVIDAYLEFIDPDENGQITELHLNFSKEEADRYRQLASAVWRHIKELNFPSTQAYGVDMKSINRFEDDLINQKI